jgi:thiosulfate dehydrogenase
MLKRTFFMLLVMLLMAGVSSAGVLDWSQSDVTAVDADTIRVYGLNYQATPGITYNVDFVFDENSVSFVPVLPSSVVVNDESKYTSADAVRGGLLYDKWWEVNGQTEPTGNHSWYPEAGQKSGADTWRCKECHGWDYKGKDGAYGNTSSSHYTGIKGVYDARNLNPAHLFALISGHNISGLAEQDIWDLVKFIKEGLVEMDKYIIFHGTQAKSATGDATNGKTLYENTGAGGGMCIMCHGADGKTIEFEPGEFVGTYASDNPWEALHKIRFGHPGSSPTMPSAVSNGLSIDDQIDILTYGQTLPTQ